jgi:hypothetical protein
MPTNANKRLHTKKVLPSAAHQPIDTHREIGISICSEKSFIELVLVEAKTSNFLTSVNMQGAGVAQSVLL